MLEIVTPPTEGLPAGWRWLYPDSGTAAAAFGDTGVETAPSLDSDRVAMDARIIDRQIRLGAYPEAEALAAQIDDEAETKGATVALLAETKEPTVGLLDEPTGPDAPETAVAVEVHRVEPREMSAADVRARRMHQYVEMSTQVKALALAAIQDEKLYKRLGCGSFKEYCEMEAGTPYSTAKLYAALGRRTAALFPGLSSGMGEAAPLQLTDGTDDEAGQLFGLGPSKLSLLFQHVDDDDDLRALASGETITLPSGREISLEEYGEMKRAEAIKEFKRDRSRLQKRALKAEDQAAALKEEVSSGRDTVRNAESEVKRAERQRDDERARADRLDAVYGGTAKRLEAKTKTVGTCRLMLNDLHQALANCGVEPEDPEELRQDLADLARKVTAIHDRFHERYAPVFSTLPDRI